MTLIRVSIMPYLMLAAAMVLGALAARWLYVFGFTEYRSHLRVPGLACAAFSLTLCTILFFGAIRMLNRSR